MKILLGAIAVCLIVLHIVFSSTWSLPAVLSKSNQIEVQQIELVEEVQFVEPEMPVFDNPIIGMSTTAKKTEFDLKEMRCLALNIYFEARSSNLADKIATADVVINRVHDKRYPSTICAVVSQGIKPGRKDCQFSWQCDGKSTVPRDKTSWAEAKAIAYEMYVYEKYRGITEGATHYHATYVKPYWAKSKQMVGRIGAHVYYRWE